MKRVLFVDDDRNVLQGMRRMLRSLRHEWEMDFAESGPEALELLAAAAYDVVVSDMRMPGMDGSQLLNEVLRLYPATARIVLSGQCDRDTVLRCVEPAHQFLTKPCDSETLKSTVARACNLRDQLVDHWRKCIVSSVTSLPSRPIVYEELIAELKSPKASIERLADIIPRDVGMTAKTLQLVSSSFFGTPQRLSDGAAVVTMLGLDTIRSLAFSTKAFTPLEGSDAECRSLDLLVEHSRQVAEGARAIVQAETDDPLIAGDAYLAGFLHDVGILSLAQPEASYIGNLLFCEAENMSFGVTHAEAGAYLMALWGLPDPIVHAVASHHSPTDDPDDSFTPLAAVHVANAVLEEETFDRLGLAGSIDVEYLARIGCADRLDAWRELCEAAKLQGATR